MTQVFEECPTVHLKFIDGKLFQLFEVWEVKNPYTSVAYSENVSQEWRQVPSERTVEDANS